MRTDARVRDPNKALASLNFPILTSNTTTLVEVSLATGLTPSGGYGYRLHDVELMGPSGTILPLSMSAGASNPYWKFQLTNSPQSAILAANSLSVLASLQLGIATDVATSDPQFPFELPLEMSMSNEVVVVSANLYLSMVCAAACAANVMCRVSYEPIKMSEVEILRIISG